MKRKNLRWCLGTAVAPLLSAALIASVWTAAAAGTKTAVLQDETGLIAVGLGSGHRNFDIWLVDPTGRRVRRLTKDAGIDVMPTWSPDGSRIAYLRRFDDESGNLEGTAGSLGAIDFGPVGHFRNNGGELCLVNTDGTGGRVLVKSFAAAAPSWSPDGQRIVFARPNKGIYVVAADGAGLHRLASGPDDYPAWSPDGKRIAFTTDSGLWIMDADGSHKRRLTVDSNWDDLGPAWSPGGDLIAFTRFTDSGRDVRVIAPDGTGGRRLAHSTGAVIDPNVAIDVAPAWSPDGTRVAFDVASRSGVSSIGMVGGDGSGLQVYRHTHDGDFHPSWSPDGKALVVTSWLAKGEGVGLLLLSTVGPPRIVIRGYNTTPAWRPTP